MSTFSRKKFILFILLGIIAIPVIGYAYQFIKKLFFNKTITGEIKSASYKIGHLLWKTPFKKITKIHQTKIVIIGSGISGLSAGRALMDKGETDFVILELENAAGGNSRYGENQAGRYPFGAHYLPIPSPDMKELISFLKEVNVIESFTETGLPIYNEQYLCAAPEDRLYINGHWQSGLVPDFGLPDEDKIQIQKFHALTDALKYAKGKDGLYAFTFPLNASSQDTSFIELDAITMKEYLIKNKFTSEYLIWYVDYCCKDDYGTSVEETSAWAGLHYFCARRGTAANAEEHDVLTWPEGNGWLMNQLKVKNTSHIYTGQLVYQVDKIEDEYQVVSLNVATGEAEQWSCSKIIFACPQFVTAHIKTNIPELKNRNYKPFTYSSWMVGNLLVKNELIEKGGVALSWDNVIYKSASLGYVNSNAQHLHRHQPYLNLTYYYVFDDKNVSRKKLLQMNHSELTAIMMNDLMHVYGDLDKQLVRYDPFIWGHAMTKPLKGFIWSNDKAHAAQPIHNNIYFAHTDLSGISVFEEGFYQGIHAVNELFRDIK